MCPISIASLLAFISFVTIETRMAPLPPIPTSYASKKAAIISSLSAPEDTYADLSPKGTVDDAIKDLIDRINALEGIVTTSSCAGRVSVFLEGRKHIKTHNGQDVREDKEATETQAAVPGGKGMGGRWLFMSHEPANLRSEKSCLSTSKQLGIEPMRGREPPEMEMEPSELRIARFQFEPMVCDLLMLLVVDSPWHENPFEDGCK